MAGAGLASPGSTRIPAGGSPSRSCCSAASPGKSPRIRPTSATRAPGYVLDSPSPYEYRYGGDRQRRAEFRTAVADAGGTNPSVLRIFWSWNASKGWSAPEEPRWEFGSEPTLCKLYVIRETAGAVVDPGDDPCNDFLSVFLPELDRLVFATSE